METHGADIEYTLRYIKIYLTTLVVFEMRISVDLLWNKGISSGYKEVTTDQK